jgi:xylulokinase
MSGQMQDLIPINEAGETLGNAILYSDGRAAEEAAYINSVIGEEHIRQITGNVMDASIPAAKLLWLKKHEDNRYKQITKVLGSSKDFIIQKLCGQSVGDYTAASTFGLMDIHTRQWDDSMLETLSIPKQILPELFYCGAQCGAVNQAASAQTGFREGTPVYAGAGDAGASTLSAGITRPDEYNIYLGTTGWIAAVSQEVMNSQGVYNLAAIPKDVYINVVPFLNAGGVHKWISDLLWSSELEGAKYDYIDSLLEQSKAGSGGLFFLPYLSGERFPVLDAKTRGAFIGLTNETSKANMVRACLEGVAFSIRQGLEAISSEKPRKISLVGGGAKTPVWRQILSDILGMPITVMTDSSEYLPSIVLSSAVFIDQGLEDSYESFLASLPVLGEIIYRPSSSSQLMNEQYQKYLKVYPAIKELF